MYVICILFGYLATISINALTYLLTYLLAIERRQMSVDVKVTGNYVEVDWCR